LAQLHTDMSLAERVTVADVRIAISLLSTGKYAVTDVLTLINTTTGPCLVHKFAARGLQK